METLSLVIIVLYHCEIWFWSHVHPNHWLPLCYTGFAYKIDQSWNFLSDSYKNIWNSKAWVVTRLPFVGVKEDWDYNSAMRHHNIVGRALWGIWRGAIPKPHPLPPPWSRLWIMKTVCVTVLTEMPAMSYFKQLNSIIKQKKPLKYAYVIQSTGFLQSWLSSWQEITKF